MGSMRYRIPPLSWGSDGNSFMMPSETWASWFQNYAQHSDADIYNALLADRLSAGGALVHQEQTTED